MYKSCSAWVLIQPLEQSSETSVAQLIVAWDMRVSLAPSMEYEQYTVLASMIFAA